MKGEEERSEPRWKQAAPPGTPPRAHPSSVWFSSRQARPLVLCRDQAWPACEEPRAAALAPWHGDLTTVKPAPPAGASASPAWGLMAGRPGTGRSGLGCRGGTRGAVLGMGRSPAHIF